MTHDRPLAFPEEVEGCACLTCRDVEHDLLRRTLVDSAVWSARLAATRPSIVLVFVLTGAIQLVARLGLPEPATGSAVLGVVGVFVARGYVGVVGADALRSRTTSPPGAVVTVGRRFPSAVGAVAVVVGGLTVTVLVVDLVVVRAMRGALDAGGVDPLYAEWGGILLAAAAVVYALVKLWFVPEACFVGGYGPIEALGVSWTITTLHFRKAVTIVGGFAVLFGVGVLLDAELAGSTSPVVLQFRYGETTVSLRSFGLSVTSVVHFVFDVLTSAVYFGIFVHEYAQGVVDR